jgi:hypothetical protein
MSQGHIGGVEVCSIYFFFLQLRGPANALSRKFVHGLTTVRHFQQRFLKKISAVQQQFSVRRGISVTARPRNRAS